MIFTSRHINGRRRGHLIGFPTINLVVPEDCTLDDGIYVVWVTIHGKAYKGALHYGAIPTFHQKETTMEVHLLDVDDDTAPDTTDAVIEVDIVEYLREVRIFPNAESLSEQIAHDVEKVRKILI